MPVLLKELCDSVINSLESPSDEFQDNIREVFCKMDEIYKMVKDDPKRVEKYCEECRHILVVLRLFPLEFKLAMDTLYKKTLCGFLSIYLDFKMILYKTVKNQQEHFDNTIREIFLLLGDEERTCIWNVVVTSHIINEVDILKILAERFIEETKKDKFNNDEYIRMIWVLHVFFSQCKKAGIKDGVAKVLEIALRLKYPPGLCKWMCHHYPGFGWKGLSDESVHETLVSEKQPKSFFKAVYHAIAKDDTLKFQLEEITRNGAQGEDSSSQSSESVNKKIQNLTQAKESDTSKKSRVDAVKADKSGKKDDKKKVVEEEPPKEKESGDLGSANKKDLKTASSKDKKQDSDAKSTKTLGPGRTKPTSATSFLDDDCDEDVDDEDTLDANIADDRSNENDKNMNDKSNIQTDDESVKAKKVKSTKKKGKFVEDSSDEESESSSLPEKKSLRSKQTRNKSPKATSDSETDINEELPEKPLTKSVKRKSGDDSDSDQTINGDESAVETKIDERGDHDEDTNDSTISSGRKISLKNKPRTKKVVKKIRIDNSPETTIEPCAEDIETISDDQKLIDEYMKGPFAWVFEKFEEDKVYKGEPYIYLENISQIVPKYEQEATLADILHTNNQRAKQKKVVKKKTRKGYR
ncbi:titin homolog [Tetranychus urticae]|uniref:Uncharacterized protein n=1 Tax=Tetranychus urticae TaxID=32264 RepID=T1JYF8_TETUR|nr:titin homolog [Tetranychus urticae]